MTEPVRNKAETDPVQIAADFFQATYGPNPPLITFIRSPRRDDRNKIIPSFFCRSTPSRDVLERVLAEGAKGTTEMFFRVAPMSRDGQPGEEAALPCAVAWAEVDHGLSDHDRDFLGSVDATIIESGGVDVRGGAKTHLYVPLDAPHPPHVVKQLNTLLRGRLGGDNAQSLAKMLRVPGTYHRKDPDNPRPVVVRRLSGGGGTSPETLATVLGAVVTHAAPPTLDRVLTPQRPAVSNMEAHAALVSVNARDERGEITNRDAALWGLYKDVVRAGITDPTEILWYALRCKVNKHHDAWLAGDVARFFVHKDYRRALSERPGAAKPMVLDFTNVGDAAPDDYVESDEEADDEPQPWPLYDLSAAIINPPPTPRPHGLLGALYRGKLHWVQGEPESGKSMLVFAEVAEALSRGETAVILDEEAGPADVADKLRALGVKAQDVRERLLYSEPAGHDAQRDADKLLALVKRHRPSIVVIDSIAAFLSNSGLDEDHAKDVTRFIIQVLLPLAHNYGAAVVVIDHLPKGNTDGRYARGSGAKLAKTDVAWRVKMVQPFHRAQSGHVQMICTKDRPGGIGRDTVIDVPVTVRDGTIRVSPSKATSAEIKAFADAIGDPTTELIEKAFGSANGGPLTVRGIMDLTGPHAKPDSKRVQIHTRLKSMLDAGLAKKTGEKKGPADLWELTESPGQL